MAKILVADDNSNVQKTVSLALTDLGVEVMSVNNGEAAVRKLADFSPDLVLADIFMPVRNGYEVCEFVKKDSRFNHVPVILLVGAFDPLDEREAQRVGADGILKKPFVPPDPLITMVKTLLDRTLGDRLVSVSVAKPVAAAVAKQGGTSIAEEPSPAPETPEFPSHAVRVKFEEGSHPVAFSQLLEAPAQDAIAPATDVVEPVDNDLVMTSTRDANLGDPIFWRNDAPEPEPDAEAPEEASTGDEIRQWMQREDSLPRGEESNLLQPVEPLVLVREEQDETSESVVETQPVVLDAAAQASLTVHSGVAPELAANPLEWMATAPAERVEEADETPGWDEPIVEVDDAIDAVEPPEPAPIPPVAFSPVPEKVSATVLSSVSAPASVPVLSQVSSPVLSPVSAQASVPPPAPSPVPPLISAPVSAQPTERIAVPVASSIPARPETVLADKPPDPNKTQPSMPPPAPAQSVEDTAHSISKQRWADLTSGSRLSLSELAAQQFKSVPEPAAQIPAPAFGNSQPAPASPPLASSLDAALVEAVVQRVLDKMRPQVVDIITKEFLRPIVQALVHREIEKQ